MIHLSIYQMAQSADYLYRAGLLDQELWEAEMKRAAGYLALPGVRQWWDAAGKTQVTPRFAEYLGSIPQSDIRLMNWEAGRGFFASDKVELRWPEA